MQNPDDLNEPLFGADAVFIASLIPTYFGRDGKPAKDMNFDEGKSEIIKPTVDGCLNILNVAKRNDIQTAIICSSTSSTNPVPRAHSKMKLIIGQMIWSNVTPGNLLLLLKKL